MGCGHWQSEYDASPCSYCAADEAASEERRVENERKAAELKAAYARIKELEAQMDAAIESGLVLVESDGKWAVINSKAEHLTLRVKELEMINELGDAEMAWAASDYEKLRIRLNKLEDP